MALLKLNSFMQKYLLQCFYLLAIRVKGNLREPKLRAKPKRQSVLFSEACRKCFVYMKKEHQTGKSISSWSWLRARRNCHAETGTGLPQTSGGRRTQMSKISLYAVN